MVRRGKKEGNRVGGGKKEENRRGNREKMRIGESEEGRLTEGGVK